MKPRITVFTLAVDDLERSLRFYRDGLGLPTQGIFGTEFEHGAVAFFDLQAGVKLAIWPRKSLSHDTGLPEAPPTATEFTLGHNVSSKEEVDAVMDEAGAAGARIVQEAHDTVWGGYAGYFQDPDGHLWEVVWNPSLKITSKRKTYNIRHEVGIKASPEAVYEALTDTNGLAGWWTSDTRGNGSEVGGLLEFWFGDSCHKFEVVQLQAGKLVRWKASKDHAAGEWTGPEVAFSIIADAEQCHVQFSHSGWLLDTGVFPHTSTKWAVFLLSLKDFLEQGKGHPAPNDVQINHD